MLSLDRKAEILKNMAFPTAIPVMAVNAYKRRFGISFLRKYYLILRTSTRHITRKINYVRLHYSRGLGLKQNMRPGIAAFPTVSFS